MFSHKKNILGFSLIELLLATVISSGLALVITRLSSNGAKSQRALSQQFSVLNLNSDVKRGLFQRDVCNHTFATVNFNSLPATLTRIGGPGRSLLQTNTDYGFPPGRIYAESITIAAVGAPSPIDATYSSLDIDLNLVFIKGKHSAFSTLSNAEKSSKHIKHSYGSYNHQSSIPLKVTYNTSTGLLHDCFDDVALGQRDSTCQALGGTLSTVTGQCEAQICLSGNCRTSFASRACPSRHVVVGITASGALMCAIDSAGASGI